VQAILSVIIGGAITAILGNWLVQRWQQNNWSLQQRQSLKTAEIEEIKRLAADIHSHTSQRIIHTRLVFSDLKEGSPRLQKSLEDYRGSVLEWNKSLGRLFSSISLLKSYSDSVYFERAVHKRFYKTSQIVDACLRTQNPRPIGPYEEERVSKNLAQIHGEVLDFNRDLLRQTLEIRKNLLEGRRIDYLDADFEELTTLELIRLLFTKDVNSSYVTRPF